MLFLQGGASLQFSMVPMNLLDAGSVADYIDAGSWADKAIEEARKVGRVHVAASTKAERYARIPDQREMTFSPDAAYVHITSNNTIEGTQYRRLPEVGDVPLVSDTSSDMFSRPIDIGRHALDLRRRAEEHGPGGRDPGHHSRRSRQALGSAEGVAADDDELRGAGGASIALQHAAGVRDLRARPGHEVAARAGRARRPSRASTSARPRRCMPKSTAPASIEEPRPSPTGR